MTDYISIDWADVRVGDVLMHENGDRLRVSIVSNNVGEVHVSGVWRREDALMEHGFTPHRRVEQVPTEPGAYHDKDGVLWVRQSEEQAMGTIVWFMPEAGGPAGRWVKSGEMGPRGPFTRLVPMPTYEQVEQVLVNEGCTMHISGSLAVMDLLAGESDD